MVLKIKRKDTFAVEA